MTNDRRDSLQTLVHSFSPEALTTFLRTAAPTFRPRTESLDGYLQAGVRFDEARKLGEIELPAAQTVLVGTVHVTGELTSRSSRRDQYDLAKAIIKAHNANAGILAFYDDAGHFRFSLITAHYYGTRRQFSNFRRHTFFVSPDAPNKTFLNQIGRADFAGMDRILQAFSLEAVSDEFYKEFKPHFDAIAQRVVGAGENAELREDLALLFVIRVIFLGFVQKKGWLERPGFLQSLWAEYRTTYAGEDRFYREWLEPLFFEALNSPPGRKVMHGSAPFSAETQKILQMAPYLNGELFKRKRGVDDEDLWIPDAEIGAFLDFLFQYNFTVEENELYDEDLELNPEFLGIIFERLTNKDQGAVYTPRVEVDLMCRLALVKWLERTTDCDQRDLYHLFFREAGTGEAYDAYQRQGDFSPKEIERLVDLLEHVTVCDPAAGSGAFEVGMMQVLDEVLSNLYARNNTPQELKANAPTPFERKKAIIATSLYGVEVKRWAVWINQLRLWLSLFVDMPDEDKRSYKPLLPNLTFKVRAGDSLVQRLGGKTFPVQGHVELPAAVKRKITELKKRKRDFFYNERDDYALIEKDELDVFRAILDAEIEARRGEIRKLLAPKPQQDSFLSMGSAQAELDLERAVAERRAELESEIADLQAQKKTLQDERPLIWSIEFAEIFFDRGGFDVVIGNPPYVRQEEIGDPTGHVTPEEYKQALQQMLRLDFPEHFARSRADVGSFKKDREPSGRSDLYTYFYIRALRLLNEEGLHVFICSNSWLDMDYGAWLQEFLLRQASTHFIIDNRARRTFTSADVNTIITVAGIHDQNLRTQDTPLRFVTFKQPFEEVVLSNVLLEIERATEVVSEERYRVFPTSVRKLLTEGSQSSRKGNLQSNGKYTGDKWGAKFLRAPDIYWTILGALGDSGLRLGDVAEVRRGVTTGANGFFHLEVLGSGSQTGLLRVRNSAGWEGEIEEEFLKPMIKTSRDYYSIAISSSSRMRLFWCQLAREELIGKNALAYIRWGEQERYHKRSSCRARSPWYALSGPTAPDLLWPSAFFERYICYECPDGFVADKVLYTITGSDLSVWLRAFLNSSVVSLLVEVEGYQLNHGGIFVTTDWLENLPVLSSSSDTSSVQKIYDTLKKRDVLLYADEVRQSDRIALDTIVLSALGIPAELVSSLHTTVSDYMRNRILKARRNVTRKGRVAG